MHLHRHFIIERSPDQVFILRIDGLGGVTTNRNGAAIVRGLGHRRSLPDSTGTPADRRSWRLIEALRAAGLVRGEEPRPDLATIRFRRVPAVYFRLVLVVPERFRRAFFLLPPPFSIPLATATAYARLRRSSLGRRLRTAPYVRRAARLGAFSATSHLEYLARVDTLARVVCESRATPLRRWITRSVRLRGSESLAPDTPALVICAHAGCYPLLLPALLASGIPLLSYNYGVGFASRTFAEISRWFVDECGWAKVTFYHDRSPASVRRFARRIASGKVGVVMPDFGSGRTPGHSSVVTNVGGLEIVSHAFGGWLAKRTNAKVYYADCRFANGGYDITIRPSEFDLDWVRQNNKEVVTQRLVLDAMGQDPRRFREWSLLGRQARYQEDAD